MPELQIYKIIACPRQPAGMALQNIKACEECPYFVSQRDDKIICSFGFKEQD